MSDASSPEHLFVAHLSFIERIASAVARRVGLGHDDVPDFVSWVRLRLVEEDYAIVRKFRGESSFPTYLTVVVTMLGSEYRVRRWGRWRPSAAARKAGTVAVRLETLVHRQGYSLIEAAELLRTSGETSLSNGELAHLLSRLPARAPMRAVEVGSAPLAEARAESSAEVLVADAENDRERHRTLASLDAALEALDPEDRMIVRMRYWDGLSIADVARALSLEQKPLYRRIERLLHELRERLTSAGIGAAQLDDLLGGPLP